ncbi:MAG TPA: hypothetical protein VIN08_22150 [Ohtaekwangia sp.]|uniref:hypothetical protein n=1 Tax=Ohtaekwangia sp. TaxID=2066019 RepID=UPI002F955CEE
MKRLLLVLFLMTAFRSFAQLATEGQTNLNMLGTGNYTARTFDDRYRGVKGTVMIVPEFVVGRIYMTDGKMIEYPKMNFDALQNDLIVMRGSNEYVIQKNKVKQFSLWTGIDSLHFNRVSTEHSTYYFYQQLVSGDFQLLKKDTKILKEANQPNPAAVAGRKQDEFVDKATYYIRAHDKLPVEVQSRKSLMKVFPVKYDRELDTYIQEHNLDIKNEQHLIMLLTYLNEIASKH